MLPLRLAGEEKSDPTDLFASSCEKSLPGGRAGLAEEDFEPGSGRFVPDRKAHRDNGARVQQKVFSTCTADFHYVADFFPVPSLWRRRPCRSGRFRGKRERPPCFWPWFGRGTVAVVHSAAPPPPVGSLPSISIPRGKAWTDSCGAGEDLSWRQRKPLEFTTSFLMGQSLSPRGVPPPVVCPVKRHPELTPWRHQVTEQNPRLILIRSTKAGA